MSKVKCIRSDPSIQPNQAGNVVGVEIVGRAVVRCIFGEDPDWETQEKDVETGI